MRFTVGGRSLDLSRDTVLDAVAAESPEPIREHLVEIGEKAFPPKQILAAATGWKRQSFTTLEAQRVLSRLGFICRRANASEREQGLTTSLQPEALSRQLGALEAALMTAQAAIAGLHLRVGALESQVEGAGS